MEDAKSPEAQAVAVETPEDKRARFVDSVLAVFGDIGHGRLWCTCGYLIWSCGLHKECDGPRALIETDHKLCKKKK